MSKPCPKCRSLMIRASMYDPDGMIALHGGIHDKDGEWWICHNPHCEDGSNNRVERTLQMTMWTVDSLQQFEEEIKNIFLEGEIRAPVHLSRGNENPLLEVFKQIKREDWVFSTHRSHYHALLKGIDPQWVKSEILAGRSIHLNNKEHRFFTSAIVGGCPPIALGVAMAIKRKRAKGHVWVFVGDMAAEAGIFYECTKYVARHNLPVTFVVEDNGLSTNTPTQLVWGRSRSAPSIIRYKYKRVLPHINAGAWVTFR